MRLSEYAKKYNIRYQTAWNHFKAGLIPNSYKLPSGTIIVKDEEIEATLRLPMKCVLYSRVSSHQQKDDLERQQIRQFI